MTFVGAWQKLADFLRSTSRETKHVAMRAIVTPDDGPGAALGVRLDDSTTCTVQDIEERSKAVRENLDELLGRFSTQAAALTKLANREAARRRALRCSHDGESWTATRAPAARATSTEKRPTASCKPSRTSRTGSRR